MRSTLSAPDLRSGADWLASANAETQDAFLNDLGEGGLAALPFLFEFWALPHQLPPDADWRVWVILGGRGAGKTRAGAEWVRSMVEGAMPLDPGRARRVALVGETYDQVRDVMVFGDSGILRSSPPDRRPIWKAGERKLVWPNVAVVLLDGTETQLELTSQQRRIARHYRIGPAQRGYDDPSYVHKTEAFDGNGLRPYSPCHLQAHMHNDGSVDVRWTRRTRIEGDSWDLPEVALGEESEIYQVRVTDGANLLREAQVQVPEWHYSSDERAADSAAGLVTIEVAQISARFGAGSARSLTLDALT